MKTKYPEILPILFAVFMASFNCVVAQEKTRSSESTTEDAQPFVQQFTDAEEVEYEFGIRIHCSGGYAQNTKVNAPIPILWPEQEVELYEETKSNNIKKISIKKLGKTASIMAFVVPRLNNGDYAEAIFRYRITRRSSILPNDTVQFEFPKRLTGKLKAYLKPSPYIDSRNKQIVAIGEKLFAENKDLPAWDQVEAVYSWVRENIKYKFDTQPHTCAETLAKGQGDCGELTALFIAICRSQGVPSREVWVPGHSYPEFYLADETGKGHWFPCQIAGQNHEFGEILEDRPIIQKGDRFKTPVSTKTKRYVEAGLSSSHSTGRLQAEHLMRKVGEK
ncbi:transglutaminase-like domain-containing protein [Mariniblastus fucicola]|uniref:Transglutaminase-like superfamily protein n=1 Tax=Mariniblastus fucicola TaxID=980251 RepID=A0A5B9PEY6_9BACT|nr:transglutaminase domain-containing protein [Mariniblastus fucicola]QEG21463.1 Transglutaminase-like superfamily protein [Mariniblastus fucicola]